MACVRFARCPEFLFLRSVACPHALWRPECQCFELTAAELAAFLVALQRRMDRKLSSAMVEIDGQMFVQRAFSDLRAAAD